MREHDIEDVWPASERVLVWLDSGPEAGSVLRKAWRLAGRLRGELIVALPAADRDLRRLAEDLGAKPVERSGRADAETIAQLVRSENAQILVLAHTPARGLRDRMRPSLIDELYGLLDNVDIHLVESSASQ
jgi:two-component system sensor histidine kinase KdpD